MGNLSQQAAEQAHAADRPSQGGRRRGRQDLRAPAGMQGLQAAAGNRAVEWALSSGVAGLPPIVQRALNGESGRPLDPALRERMEARLGHDFRGVRIHTGEQAEDSALAVGARAYTVGHHVVFGAGRYAPEHRDGERLLAHELAHVVQQGRGGPRPALDARSAHETAADRASRDAVASDSGPVAVAGATGVGLARDGMTVEDVEHRAWSHVPGWLKPAVRPLAQEARSALHAVVDPKTELPLQAQPIVETALRAEQALLAPAVTPAAAPAKPSSTTAAQSAPAAKPKPSRWATLAPLAKQFVRDKALSALGTTKGVALEAANIVDTVVWAETIPHRFALEQAAEMGLIDKKRYEQILQAGKQHGLVDQDTDAPAVSGAVARVFDWGAEGIEGADVFKDASKENTVLFSSYELGELGGAIGSQVGLAAIGVEEVQLALKAVGALGSAKALITSMRKNKNWERDPQFWMGLLGVALSILGLRQTKAAGKMLRMVNFLMVSGALATAGIGVWKLYNDYFDEKLAADPHKRDMVLARDLAQITQILVHAIRGLISKGATPGAGAGEPETGTAPRPAALPEGETGPVKALPPGPQPKGLLPESTTGAPTPKALPPGPQPKGLLPESTTGTRPKPGPAAQKRAPSGGGGDDAFSVFDQGETGPFRAEGPVVRVPVRPTGEPARVLEVGAGMRETNLGLPPEPQLVQRTATDINPQRPGVQRLDATANVPPEHRGQYDTVIVNNPRGYKPDIPKLGEALRPGGRIIIQGRTEVPKGQPGINPDFKRVVRDLEGNGPPSGYRLVPPDPAAPDTKILKIPGVTGKAIPANKPADIMGGPFYRTTGEPVGWPNARVVLEQHGPAPDTSKGTFSGRLAAPDIPEGTQAARPAAPRAPEATQTARPANSAAAAETPDTTQAGRPVSSKGELAEEPSGSTAAERPRRRIVTSRVQPSGSDPARTPAAEPPVAAGARQGPISPIEHRIRTIANADIIVGVHATVTVAGKPAVEGLGGAKFSQYPEPRATVLGGAGRAAVLPEVSQPPGTPARLGSQPSSGLVIEPPKGSQDLEVVSWNTGAPVKGANVSHAERQVIDWLRGQDPRWVAGVREVKVRVFGRDICEGCDADIRALQDAYPHIKFTWVRGDTGQVLR